jgi:hypothetical protein
METISGGNFKGPSPSLTPSKFTVFVRFHIISQVHLEVDDY